MPDSPTPTVPTPPTNGKTPRAKSGFISRDLLDALSLADDCHLEAAKPDIAPALTLRAWTAADQTKLGGLLTQSDDFQNQIADARAGKGTGTEEETKARAELLTALDPILKGVRRTFANSDAERSAFGIGQNLSNADTAELLRFAKYARDQLSGTPPKAVLKGVLATEIAAIATLADKYEAAGWAQGQAQQKASDLLLKLRALVENEMNPLRRDLQHAADMAYPHRIETNAAQRKAFGLQPDRPFV